SASSSGRSWIPRRSRWSGWRIPRRCPARWRRGTRASSSLSPLRGSPRPGIRLQAAIAQATQRLSFESSSYRVPRSRYWGHRFVPARSHLTINAAKASMPVSASGRLEAGADQFLVVAGENVLIGERRMGPGDAAALVELPLCRLDELRAADLFIALGGQLAD